MSSKKDIIRKKTILIIMICLLPIVMFISLKIGYAEMSISDLLRILAGEGTKKENLFILDFRLPRILIAALVGIGFSLSGCILQGITKNPLADPGILGINAGAGLTVVLFIVLKGTLNFNSIFLLPVFSLIGATIIGFLIYHLSTSGYSGIEPIRLVLNGIAIQAGLNGLMMLIILKLDGDQHEFLALWQAGSIWKSNWKLVIALTPWIVVGFVIAIILSHYLDLLSLGDERAIGLGVEVKRRKKHLLFLAITLAASSVAFSGSISFIGLISPHMARRLIGNQHKYLVPASGFVGAILMVLSDTVARKIMEPSELPTGIVVVALGAPYFLFLLLRTRKKQFS